MLALYRTSLLLMAVLVVNADNYYPIASRWVTHTCLAVWPSTDVPYRSIPSEGGIPSGTGVNQRNLVPPGREPAKRISSRNRKGPFTTSSSNETTSSRSSTARKAGTLPRVSQKKPPAAPSASTSPSVQISPEDRIVGGYATSIFEVPYQLQFRLNGQTICGASIIGPFWALTAAHCCKAASKGTITLVAGSTLLSSGGTSHRAIQKTIHNLYNTVTTDYDCCLIKVSPAFNIFGGDKGIAAVALPRVDEPVPTGALAFISGWGSLQVGGPVSNQLQGTTVPIVSQEECTLSYGAGKITANMICAGFKEGGHDACQGDSGGPLVLFAKLIGVTSRGQKCALAGYPGIYTRVAAIRGWIKNISGI